MGTQIVHHQMDRVGLWIAGHDLHQIVGELGGAAIGSRFGEMASGLWFNAAEDVGRAAPFIFAIAAQNLPRTHRPRRADIGVQNHRFLVDANHWFPLRQRLFVYFEHIFHMRDVLFIQFRHAPHFFPATASDRGSEEEGESSPDSPAAPTFA